MTRYFTHNPCVNGHIAERLLSNRTCVQCMKERLQEWRTRNRGKYSDKQKEWSLANPECARDAAMRWNEKHPEEAAAIAAAAVRRRQVQKKNACPPWADQSAILAIYKKCRQAAKDTGIAHHVDHIIPLQGRYVRGLHIAENLQILTSYENRHKSARYE